VPYESKKIFNFGNDANTIQRLPLMSYMVTFSKYDAFPVVQGLLYTPIKVCTHSWYLHSVTIFYGLVKGFPYLFIDYKIDR
jgi:hypothetical protein